MYTVHNVQVVAVIAFDHINNFVPFAPTLNVDVLFVEFSRRKYTENVRYWHPPDFASAFQVGRFWAKNRLRIALFAIVETYQSRTWVAHKHTFYSVLWVCRRATKFYSAYAYSECHSFNTRILISLISPIFKGCIQYFFNFKFPFTNFKFSPPRKSENLKIILLKT